MINYVIIIENVCDIRGSLSANPSCLTWSIDNESTHGVKLSVINIKTQIKYRLNWFEINYCSKLMW